MKPEPGSWIATDGFVYSDTGETICDCNVTDPQAGEETAKLIATLPDLLAALASVNQTLLKKVSEE